MTLGPEEWKEVLNTSKIESVVGIIEQIKEELKKQDQDIYQMWSQKNFDINYRFNVLVTIGKGQCIAEVTLLHLAAENGNTDVVRALLEKGAGIDEKNKYGFTPLHLAAENGHTDYPNTLFNRIH